MKKFNKGLTISKEELELIGFYIENAIKTPLHNGTRPDRFDALKNIQVRLEESKNNK